MSSSPLSPTAHTPAHAHAAAPTRSRGATPLILALGLAAMVVAMAQTQVVPILSLLQHKLNASAAGVSWVTTATLLSAAVFTPLLGRVGDQYGKKPTLVAVLVVMVAGSALAATTSSLGLLILARVLQGSATAIFPLGLSVIRDEVPRERLAGAMAMVSGTLAFGSGLSLVVTGVLTQGSNPDYHLVFWFSTGLAVIALLAVVFLVPFGGERPGGRIDYLGAGTLAVFLVALLLGISQGHEWGWSSGRIIGCFAGAAVMAAVWVLVELKVSEPLVDMRMFVHRQVGFTNVAGLFVGFGSFAQFIGISYLVQVPKAFAGYGFTASVLRASVEYLLPSALIALFAAPIGGMLVRRVGARVTLALGAVVGAGGFAWLAWGHGRTAEVIIAGMLTGISISMGYASMPALIAGSVPMHQTGIANGINSISRSVGSSIASAVITSLLASKTISGLPAGVVLPKESQFTLSFIIAMVALAATIAVALLGLSRTRAAAPRTAADDAAAEDDPALLSGSAGLDPLEAASLVGALSGSGLHGRVLGADGSPVARAAITLIDQSGRQLGRATAHQDGRYAVRTPGAGSYVLIASAGGHQPTASTIAVGHHPVLLDLRLAGTGGVLGTVLDTADEKPVPQATVVATDHRGEVAGAAVTDAAGEYALRELLPGGYTLAVNAAGHRPTALPVEVSGGAPLRTDIRIAPAAALSGTVRATADGRPLADARVTLLDPAGHVVGITRTAADGGYAFTDLDGDHYTVIAAGYPPQATTLTLESSGRDDFDLTLTHEEN
jgi:MFS family permease